MKTCIYILLFLILTPLLRAEDLKKSEEYQIGIMVKSIAAAIKAPDKADSMATIAKYGTDTRYYVMIRGWLAQELTGVQSQYDATRDNARKARFKVKLDFLKKAIRRIDLE
jgi:hypothetical protein